MDIKQQQMGFKRQRLNDIAERNKELIKQKDELKAVIMLIIYQLIEKTGEWNWLNANKYQRLNKAIAFINSKIDFATRQELNMITAGLKDRYGIEYNEMMKMMGKEPKSITDKEIKAIIEHPWSGLNYKDRIITTNNNLKLKVKQNLTQTALQGLGLYEISQGISKSMETSKNNSSRILLTESARIDYVADRQAFSDAGVEKVQYNATFDNTCVNCESLHGNIYILGNEPGLPRHPFCNCYYEPVEN